jgi:outer membrane protein assembly factor BamB
MACGVISCHACGVMPPLFPSLLTLLFGSLLTWLWLTDNVMRSLALAVLSLLWIVLIGLWWALRERGVRMRRMLVFVLGLAGLFFFFRLAVRYEGSADGSAFPQLRFTWQKSDTPQAPELREKLGEVSAADVAPPGAVDMPRFLGVKGDGVLPEPAFALDWKVKAPREVWRIQIGAGWSGFAITGHRAITQEQRGPQECVTCYDLRSGQMLWSHTDEALFTEMLGGDGPRATPSIDAVTGKVFTLGGTGILNCLDLSTGAKAWQRDVLKDSAAPRNLEWGKSASPLLTAKHVICSGGDSGTSLIAYDRSSGEIAWKAGTDGGSYVSPVIVKLAGREQLLSVNRGSVTGHEPSTGRQLWSFEWPGGFPKVGQPLAVGENKLLLTSSYGVKTNLLEITANHEVRSLWAESAPRTKFSSASIFGGIACAIDEGTLCAIDLATGERLWREVRCGFGQQIRLGEQHLLVQAEKGHVLLLRITKEAPIEVARLDALTSKTWNPPTLAGRWLLLRNDREAICYELQAP